MRYVIEVPDAVTHQVVTALIALIQLAEQELGDEAQVGQLVMGMVHQLGEVSLHTLAQQNPEDLFRSLCGLAAFATVYMKALVVKDEDDDGQDPT